MVTPNIGSSDKHRGLLPGRFFKINQNKPLTFSSTELAICDLPSLYESVTLDSLSKQQMADALMHLKKMTGNKHNKPLLERRVKNSSLGLLCLLPYYVQSAGTALDVKGWQGVSYSLLTKAPCQAFTSKLEE